MIDQSKLNLKLSALGNLLVNQEKAKVIVPAQAQEPEFWFGGGNVIEFNGKLYVSGRYRNGGDSRTGTAKGTRGSELAIFSSPDGGNTWNKVKSFSKEQLSFGDTQVVSIEGSSLHITDRGVELYISTEKSGRAYPKGYEHFLKPGTGIWSIDRIVGQTVEELSTQSITPILQSDDPSTIHIKDPFVYDTDSGDTVLLFCHHPFTWASSNTGYCVRKKNQQDFSLPVFDHFPRGNSWDVAITRGTALLDLGQIDGQKVTLVFYDGGESLRKLEEHTQAKKRPRGYSCEEIGGLAYLVNENLQDIRRISEHLPMFMSPWGLQTSRYVDVCRANGNYYVTWQQSQKDGSQPLVMNTVSEQEVKEVLHG